MMAYASVERERIDEYVAKEAADTRRAVTDFVSALELGAFRSRLHTDDATPYAAHHALVERERPALMVVGTRRLTRIRPIVHGRLLGAGLFGLPLVLLAVQPTVEAR